MKKAIYLFVLAVLADCVALAGCGATPSKSYIPALEPGTKSTSLKIASPQVRDAPKIASIDERSAEVSFYSDSIIYGCPDFKLNKKGYLYTQKITKSIWYSSVRIPADKNVYALLANRWNDTTIYSAFKFTPQRGVAYELEVFAQNGLDDGPEYKLMGRVKNPDGATVKKIEVEEVELSRNLFGGGDAYYIKESACTEY